jgi:hypothetical protein
MQTKDEESDGGDSAGREKKRKKIFVLCFFIIWKPAAVADVWKQPKLAR